jgi:hypothetical protein
MRTGRRAWRKWLRSQRKHDKDSWSALLGAVRGRASYARKHRGTNAGQGLPEEPGTDTVRSFTARSLVGMTMGARKRRARGLVGDLGHMLYGDYRIGQRLRPCLGCYRCCPMPCHFAMAMYACDGSGVLPARKAVDTVACVGFDGPCNAVDAKLRTSRTIYHWDGKGTNPNRPRMLCDECYRSYTAYWDEMWAQVNG